MRPTVTYRILELGGSAVDVGWVSAAYGVCAVFLAVPLGRKIDTGDPRRYFLGGIATTAAGALLSAAAPSLIVLALGQLLLGLGWMTAAIGFQTLVSNRRNSDRDRGFSRLSVAAASGQLVGPFVAGLLLSIDATRVPGGSSSLLTLVVAGLIGMLAIGVGLLTTSADPGLRGRATDAPVQPASPLRTIVRREGVPQALVVNIAYIASTDLTVIYLPLIGEARGIGPSVVGTLLSLRAISSMISRMSMPRLLDFFGRRRLLLGATLLAGISLLGVSFASTVWLLVPMLAAMGFGLGVGTPLTMAWLTRRTPREDRGTALAIRMTGNRLGQTIFPIGFGAMAGVLGPGTVFLVMAASMFTGATVLRTTPLDDAPPTT